MPKLEQLLFSDPDWGASPIARLCNYATYSAVNLPNLQTLDSQALNAQTKAVAEATYLKKKMYYNMRISTLRRKAAALAQQAQQGLGVGQHTLACISIVIADSICESAYSERNFQAKVFPMVSGSDAFGLPPDGQILKSRLAVHDFSLLGGLHKPGSPFLPTVML